MMKRGNLKSTVCKRDPLPERECIDVFSKFKTTKSLDIEMER